MRNSENALAHWRKMLDRYTYHVTWSNEDNRFVGLCAEFPSLNWLDATPEKALRGIRKVVADMQANGKSVPEPISQRRYSGKFLVRVPPEVHRKLALEAAEENVSLNRVVSARQSS